MGISEKGIPWASIRNSTAGAPQPGHKHRIITLSRHFAAIRND